MVLPTDLAKLYRQKASRYNQTASKAEQIALVPVYPRRTSGSSDPQAEKTLRIKTEIPETGVQKVFGQDVPLQIGAAGTSLALTLSTSLTWKELEKKAQTRGLRLQLLQESPGKVTLILSCSSMPVQDFPPACSLLKEITDSSGT